MNQLKFLGKPAPEYLCCCGYGEYCNERAGVKDCPCEAKIERLEGAIKEAEQLLLAPNISGKLSEVWKEWNLSLNTFRGTRHKFVAFLLRKTIGERT